MKLLKFIYEYRDLISAGFSMCFWISILIVCVSAIYSCRNHLVEENIKKTCELRGTEYKESVLFERWVCSDEVHFIKKVEK